MQLRIFVSSPGDVGEERRLTQGVIDRLRFEWSGRVDLAPIFWEHEPLRATASFQKEISKPSDADVVVCILWSRLGTRLPSDLTREDGSRYASGTEYELEDAARGFRENGSPDLLVYRKTAQAVTELDSEEQVLERLRQKKSLDGFIDRWFRDVEGSFTAAFHNFAEPARFEELLHSHLDKLIESRLEKAPADAAADRPAPLWDRGSPFRGLESFGPEHAPIFCGRTAEVADILNLLRRQNAAGKPFLLVLGPSGCGKSSLVRAGVMPGLTEPNVIEGIGLWRSATFVPGTSPDDLLTGLATALLDEAALGNELRQVGIDAPQLAARLRDEPGTALPLLRSALTQAAHSTQMREELTAAPEARLALVIDQLEELFTIERFTVAERALFDAALDTLVRSGAVWVLATLRSDFYAPFTQLTQLAELKEGSGQYDLRPPGPAEMAQMIRQPARIAGLDFEEDARSGERLDDVLRDAAVTDPEALPLLQFTLDELYKRRDENDRLTLAAYRGLGGVEGALASRAEEVFSKLSPEAQARLDTVLLALVTVSADGNLSRRRAPLDAITAAPEARALVDAFIAQRLLVTDRAKDGTAVVSVAHEALLRRWPRAQEWLRANEELLASAARIKSAAALWRQENKDAGYLLPPGDLLDSARAIQENGAVPLTPEESAFIDASSGELAAHGRRRTLRLLAVAGGVAVLAIAGWVLLQLFVFAHVDYHHDFVRRWGEPVGVGKVSSGERKRRQATLEFHRRGRLGPVHEIRAVDSRGRLTPLHDVGGYIGESFDQSDLSSRMRECAWRFHYQGRELIRETALNCYNQQLHEIGYTEPTRGAVSVKAGYLDKGIVQPQAESGAAMVQLTRNGQGLDRRVEYLSREGERRSDPNGSYGFAIEEFDVTGKPKSILNLGRDDVPTMHRDGFVRAVVAYDAAGRVTEWRFFNVANQPTINRFGFARAKLEYDRYGNVTLVRMFDRRGEPLAGIAAMRNEYDRRGNLVRTRFLDAADRPTLNAVGFATQATEYDREGNLTAWTFLDAEDRPMVLGNGVARVEREYGESADRRGPLTRLTSVFARDLEPRFRRRLTARAFYDEHDDPTHRSDGVARIEYLSDPNGNIVAESYLEEGGDSISPLQLRYATIRRQYDSDNRLAEETYHNARGEPTRNAEGVLGKRFAYREDRLASATNIDTAGQPMESWNGEASVEWEYDENREFIVESYRDVRGDKVAGRGRPLDGYPRFATKAIYYDNSGRVSALGFLDAAGEWMTFAGSVEVHQPAVEPPGPWWGESQLWIEVPGCVFVNLTHDSQGHLTEVSCLDVDEEVVNGTAGGYAIKRHHYDDLARLIGFSFLDARQNPVSPSVEIAGLAERVPLPARTRARLNAFGQQIEETYLDPQGQPTDNVLGHARIKYSYDRWGRLAEQTFYDAADRPVRNLSGFAQETRTNGARGELRVQAFHDESGSLTINQWVGYARVEYDYDEFGNPVREARFDETDRPLAGATSEFCFDYSRLGQVLLTARDEKGNEVATEAIQRSANPDQTWQAVQRSSAYQGNRPAVRTAAQQPAPRKADPPPAQRPVSASAPPAKPVAPPRADPDPPIVPAGGALEQVIDSLYRLSEEILDTHEDYLDDQGLDTGPLYRALDRFYEGAEEMRTAYRRASGQTLGHRTGITFRKRSADDRARALEAQVTELRRLAGEVDRAARGEALGPAATREWRQILSYLARVESEI